MKKFTVILLLFIVALLITACGSSDEEPIEVTFTGEGCTVTGPTELSIGEHTFIFKDVSDKRAHFFVRRFEEPYTIQDIFDLQSYPGEWIDSPSWVVSTSPRGYEWNETTDEYIGKYDLEVEGNYGLKIYTLQVEDDEIWYCAPFTVK